MSACPSSNHSKAQQAMFTNNVNAGSQIAHNSGPVVNHFYGPQCDQRQTERAFKRRRIGEDGTDNIQDWNSTICENLSYDIDSYDALFKSLLFDRMDFRVNNVRKALLTTCEWLLTHPDFEKWYHNDGLDDNNGFLWIKGKPGCGKSTLMRAAYDWACKRNLPRVTGSLRIIVPYFFNARASASLEKSSLGLYRTVVYRLLDVCQPLRNLFMNSFARKDPGSSGQDWTQEELQGFLCDAVESTEAFELHLFIDALDEADYEDDVRDMITFLIQLSDRSKLSASACTIHVCLSSRHYPHISIGRGSSLTVEEQPGQGQDIEKYISKQLICQDSDEKDELASQILKKSARIFLWVVLVVEILRKLIDRGASLADMTAHLNTIPAGLDELFHNILIQSDHGIETSILLFQWMIFGFRALEPEELFIAIEYSKTGNNPIQSSVPSDDRLAKFMLNCSHGLVEIVEVTSSKHSIVQFIHETVREFLMKDKGLPSILPALGMNLAGISHEILRIACYRYLTTTVVPQQIEYDSKADFRLNYAWKAFQSKIRLETPFLNYTSTHLFDHAEQAQRHNMSQKAFLSKQINRTGDWLDSCRLWWNVVQRYKTKQVAAGVKLLNFIIEQQHLGLMSVLLDVLDDRDIDMHHQYSMALVVASASGFLQGVEQLLKKNVAINFRHKRSGSALEGAVRGGYEKIVPMLLSAGADVDFQEGEYESLLRVSWQNGHEKIAQMLLDAGAHINSSVEMRLRVASRLGKEKVVQVLLDSGAEIISQGDFSSALVKASEYGHENIVQMLLDAGADANTPSGGPLRSASLHGHERIVRKLLDAGANVNEGSWGASFDISTATALQFAWLSGHGQVVQILLNAGADVEDAAQCQRRWGKLGILGEAFGPHQEEIVRR